MTGEHGRDLSGATFHDVDLARIRIRGGNLYRADLRGMYLVETTITGEVRELVINGVDVTDYVYAEMDRRDPDRPLMRATDVAGLRHGYAVISDRWDETVARARRLPEERLHESVEEEWSFVETLRHLVFATESWVGRAIGGDPAPWHPLSLPWDGMDDTPGVPRDRTARPSLDEVLALREDRRALVHRCLADLDDADLERDAVPPTQPGWPPADLALPVGECLRIVLNEEYEHRRYAERDLAVLEA